MGRLAGMIGQRGGGVNRAAVAVWFRLKLVRSGKPVGGGVPGRMIILPNERWLTGSVDGDRILLRRGQGDPSTRSGRSFDEVRAILRRGQGDPSTRSGRSFDEVRAILRRGSGRSFDEVRAILRRGQGDPSTRSGRSFDEVRAILRRGQGDPSTRSGRSFDEVRAILRRAQDERGMGSRGPGVEDYVDQGFDVG